MSEITEDALFGGAVVLLQPARGYRVNVDSLLLAAFAAGAPGPLTHVGRLCDLGAGVGAVGLALFHLVGAEDALFVERNERLARLCEQNLKSAGARAEVAIVDVADLSSGASFDLVVCNPPFFPEDRARPSADPLARCARFGELAPFVSAAAKLVGSRGRAAFAYPARSLPELLTEAEQKGLVAKRLRLVHPSSHEAARLALVELRRAKRGGLVVEPPLVEWDAPGVRSSELSGLCERPTDDRT